MLIVSSNKVNKLILEKDPNVIETLICSYGCLWNEVFHNSGYTPLKRTSFLDGCQTAGIRLSE